MAQDSYRYEERVLLAPSRDTWNVRIESYASWNHWDVTVHPFSQTIDELLHKFPQIARLWIQTGSAPSSSFPTAALDAIPPIPYSHPTPFTPAHMGPSGLSVILHTRQNPQSSEDFFDVQAVIDELVARRLIGAPLGDKIQIQLDSYQQQGEVSRFEQYTSPQTLQVYQLHLPTNGAAFSADALRQAFTSVTPSSCTLLRNATALSKAVLGVTTSIARRGIWLEMTNIFGRHSISQGITYSLPNKGNQATKWAEWLVPGTTVQSCPLADHFAAHTVEWNGYEAAMTPLTHTPRELDIHQTRPTSLPIFSITKSVQRPQGMAYTGTLQTTVVNHHDACVARVQFRDVLPNHLLRPSWQTLEVVGGVPQVQFQQDYTIIRIDTYLAPEQALTISIDYQPILLGFQDFPGDPNRGMELPPAIVTLQCSNNVGNLLSQSTTLFSNTLILLPPVPDMSMPFNVTSLTCSLYAYVFGSIIAFLVKKSSEKMRYKLYPDEKPKSKLQKLKEKIASKFQRTTGETTAEADGKETPEVERSEAAETHDKVE